MLHWGKSRKKRCCRKAGAAKIAAMLLALMTGITPVYALENNNSVLNDGWLGTITVHYGTDTEGDLSYIPKGAEFDFYKIADMNTVSDSIQNVESTTPIGKVALSYHSLIQGVEITESTRAEDVKAETVRQYQAGSVQNGEVYRGVIDDYGTCTIPNVETGKYLAVEKANGSETTHMLCDPFLVSVPESTADGGADVSVGWDYDVDVYPKVIPLGNIEIKKRTEGDNAEADRSFHFVIRLSEPSSTIKGSGDGEKIHESLYTCRYNTGGEVKVGNDSVIKLKNGESATISGIPAGTEYRILEKEANKDGYETVFKNAKGNVNPAETTSVLCRNIRNKDKTSGTLDTADKAQKIRIMIAVMIGILIVGTEIAILGRRKKNESHSS